MVHAVPLHLRLLGVSSAALLALAGCSSGHGGSAGEDAGHEDAPADHKAPKADAGRDAGHHDGRVADAVTDGHKKDVERDGTVKDAPEKKDAPREAGPGDAAADGPTDAAGNDGAPADGATDVRIDGRTDGAPHVHDGAADAKTGHDGAADAKTGHDGAADARPDAHDAAPPAPVQNYFMGRWDTTSVTAANQATGVGSVAEWPGSGVITTFTGGNIGVTLTDTCNASGECDTVTVELDGVAVAAAMVGTMNTSTGTVITAGTSKPSPFTLASGGTGNVGTTILLTGVTAGNHTIGVYKNTDSFYGGSYVFDGFTPYAGNPANIIKASYVFAHHIEWVGDDITAGAGDNSANLPPAAGYDYAQACPENAVSSNEYFGYSRLVSEYFDAERHNLSVASLGVYESDYPQTSLIAPLYLQVLPVEADGGAAWGFASFTPDLVVVNLGSYGDFSNVTTYPPPTGLVPGYQTALEGFLQIVRAKHPDAFILVVSGNGYGGDESSTEAVGWTDIAVSSYAAAAHDLNITYFPVDISPTENPIYGTGAAYACQWRPSVAGQADLAAQVEAEIETLLRWKATAWAP
jgi:hypothetical protein